MSLTQNDLMQIRFIIHEAVDPLNGKIEALQNDVKDIYFMLADHGKILSQHTKQLSQHGKQLSQQSKHIQKLDTSINYLAEKQGVALPL